MAYSGFLLKIGDYIVPDKYIGTQNYSAYINTQTLDPYTDGDGLLHMSYVSSTPLKIEFTTPNMLTGAEFAEFMQQIKRQTIDGNVQRKFYCTAYIPELDDYVTQLSYLADFKPNVYGTYGGTIRYNSISFSIIGGLAEHD